MHPIVLTAKNKSKHLAFGGYYDSPLNYLKQIPYQHYGGEVSYSPMEHLMQRYVKPLYEKIRGVPATIQKFFKQQLVDSTPYEEVGSEEAQEVDESIYIPKGSYQPSTYRMGEESTEPYEEQDIEFPEYEPEDLITRQERVLKEYGLNKPIRSEILPSKIGPEETVYRREETQYLPYLTTVLERRKTFDTLANELELLRDIYDKTVVKPGPGIDIGSKEHENLLEDLQGRMADIERQLTAINPIKLYANYKYLYDIPVKGESSKKAIERDRRKYEELIALRDYYIRIHKTARSQADRDKAHRDLMRLYETGKVPAPGEERVYELPSITPIDVSHDIIGLHSLQKPKSSVERISELPTLTPLDLTYDIIGKHALQKPKPSKERFAELPTLTPIDVYQEEESPEASESRTRLMEQLRDEEEERMLSEFEAENEPIPVIIKKKPKTRTPSPSSEETPEIVLTPLTNNQLTNELNMLKDIQALRQTLASIITARTNISRARKPYLDILKRYYSRVFTKAFIDAKNAIPDSKLSNAINNLTKRIKNLE